MNRSPSVFHQVRFWFFLLFALVFLVPATFFVTPWQEFKFIVIFLEVILLFNIMIIVHELGHFWAALWCGMKVEKFAIWFGPALWKKKVHDVEYILGSIPAGGYVALPQMANPDALEGKSELTKEELPPATPWQKIVVAFAGPLFSLLLAFAFATVVYVVGHPVYASEKTTVIGFVRPNGPADLAGLKAGDKILSVDGHEVNRFTGIDGVSWRIVTSINPTIDFVVERDGQQLLKSVSPKVNPDNVAWYKRGALRQILIAPEMNSVRVKTFYPNSPAELGGMKAGDQIIELNGEKMFSPAAIDGVLLLHPNDPLKIKILRAGQTLDLTVLPKRPLTPQVIPKDEPQTSIGIDEFDDRDEWVLDHPLPWQQVWEGATSVTETLKALFTPHSPIGISHLSGPVGIMNLFTVVLSNDYGWQRVLWWAVLINVNLAIMNLLPFPVLDGGHITLSFMEILRRRPLSFQVLEPLQTGFALLLFGFIGFVTFFDVQDSAKLVGGMGANEIRFAAPDTSSNSK